MHPCRRAAVLCAAALLFSGCAKPLPPQTDPAEARSALTAALDAWKDGQPPDSLRGRKPPVDFRDPGWDAGARLTGYEVKSEERSGQSVRFAVELSLSPKDGGSKRRVVNYNADAGKGVVIRPDFGP